MKIPVFFNLLVFSFLLSCNLNPDKAIEEHNKRKFTLVIHGGAGTILRENITPESEKAFLEKLSEALNAGYVILEMGGTALDAVEASVNIMEDSPLFNAGKGSVFSAYETQEMDASVMDGNTGKAGAVASVRTIKNPITAARAVMENSPHVLLVGEGAQEFAKLNGLELVNPDYFFDEKRWEQFQQSKKAKQDSESKHGTVGAVALDRAGNLASATSTGGMTNKQFGRIGDSPLIGAGTYANNKTCAISATGHGEYFIRGVISYDIAALMEYKNLSLEVSANEVILNKLTKAGGTGGIIGVDAKGNFVMTFNTPGMYRAYKTSAGKSEVLIFKE